MLRLTTMVTAAALLASLPASASPANLVLEQHYSESGYQVDLYATQDSDGVLTEVTLTEPDTVERVDLWTDGETIYWSGTVDGELAEGSVPVREIDSEGSGGDED